MVHPHGGTSISRKKEEALTPATTGMGLGVAMPGEATSHIRTRAVQLHLGVPRAVVETESRRRCQRLGWGKCSTGVPCPPHPFSDSNKID